MIFRILLSIFERELSAHARFVQIVHNIIVCVPTEKRGPPVGTALRRSPLNFARKIDRPRRTPNSIFQQPYLPTGRSKLKSILSYNVCTLVILYDTTHIYIRYLKNINWVEHIGPFTRFRVLTKLCGLNVLIYKRLRSYVDSKSTGYEFGAITVQVVVWNKVTTGMAGESDLVQPCLNLYFLDNWEKFSELCLASINTLCSLPWSFFASTFKPLNGSLII